MKFPFFASFIVFCLWLAIQLKKRRKIDKEQEKIFWEREMAANSVRKKSLEHLDYITIPVGNLPPNSIPESSYAAECYQILHTLSEQKVVNFTGITNTDLKLQYGAPNINLLMEYDQNYTLLVRSLQTIAEEYCKFDMTDKALPFLEFAISVKTDISKSYFLLADIYDRMGRTHEITKLIEVAESINSPLKASIVRTLQGSGPYNDLLRSS